MGKRRKTSVFKGYRESNVHTEVKCKEYRAVGGRLETEAELSKRLKAERGWKKTIPVFTTR